MPIEDPILTIEQRLQKLEADRLETVHDGLIFETLLEAVIEAATTALREFQRESSS